VRHSPISLQRERAGPLLLAAVCVNLASAFAARAWIAAELAVRVALGSSRLRLIRQLLTEALVITLMGARGAEQRTRAARRA
jgi:hypothetical protein